MGCAGPIVKKVRYSLATCIQRNTSFEIDLNKIRAHHGNCWDTYTSYINVDHVCTVFPIEEHRSFQQHVVIINFDILQVDPIQENNQNIQFWFICVKFSVDSVNKTNTLCTHRINTCTCALYAYMDINYHSVC